MSDRSSTTTVSVQHVEERQELLRGVQQLLLSLTAICTFAISVWVVVKPPARGYEEMYEAYPDLFWALITVGLLASMLVFITSSIRKDGYWKVALAFACTIYFLFNFLPIFRGWAMYGRGGADVLAHIGYAKTILRTGHLPVSDFYPSVHILLAELRLIGLEWRIVSPLLSAFFMVAYVLGIYLFSRQLTGRKWIAVVTLAVALIPLYDKFQHSFHPAIFSFMLFPLYLFHFDRYRTSSSNAYLVLTLFMSIVLVVFHPVTSLYALIALTVSFTVRVVYERITAVSFDYMNDVRVMTFLIAVWVFWYSRFPSIRQSLKVVVGLVEDTQPSVATSYGAQQLQTAVGLHQIVVGFINRYGPIFLVCGLASIAALVVLRKMMNGRPTFPGVWLSAQFSAGIAIALVSLFTYVIAYNPVRNSRYMILMATLFTGLLLYWLLHTDLLERRRLQRAATVAVVLLLFASVPIVITHSYHSWTHMTYSSQDGTEWFYDYSAPDSVAVSNHVTEKVRMYHQGGYYSKSGFVGFGDAAGVPPYFGYRNHSRVGQVVNGTPTYLVTKEFDLEYYRTLKDFVQSDYVVYTEETLRKLDDDRSVNKIYTNGGYTIWFVNGSASPNSSRLGDPRLRPSNAERDGTASLRQTPSTSGSLRTPSTFDGRQTPPTSGGTLRYTAELLAGRDS